MKISERFKGCILGGAIGDAYGSSYENITKEDNSENTYYLFGKPKVKIPKWRITDDTQLTLATCEAIIENESLNAEVFAEKYLEYFKSRKITGIGASTLKALQELEVGGHWSLVGRKGEYGAGNGSAMRIAPLGFETNITRDLIKDVCNITHQNDEAYIGALSVIIAIQSILNETWTGKENLIKIITDQLPDTRVRDRLIEIDNLKCDLKQVGELGNDGYVVNSIPLAIAFASKVNEIGLTDMYKQIIELGGDTDTNCSIAGQIAGTLIGIQNIPIELTNKLKELNDFAWINGIVDKYVENKNWAQQWL
ncbi:ADP-ribosylglycohydrolase family protein [Winogradskyella immobilis]|uniref:ADP-ribosylglycohydrolase family protein n=1 Tax=Winogradskyella immobilis TaxID=2816852 RepID=A0ABS8ERK3_9FLAO|nr:ADP-ribosylglycohydrolase family protein [Winogradskyella immobilis]MCC1485642.1 ADP-ribosylglycohydrolase family protein [Winogradskyella immobilis]MCG0017735.1 ADP-ribosylglycohydrolase family protein [Winogradskyella immobilis]